MENRPPTWTILNHLPPGPGEGPGENNIVRDERVYLFQGSPGNEPKVLYLFSDGNFDLVPNAHPSEADVLELIGHSNGLLCFKNKSQRRLLLYSGKIGAAYTKTLEGLRYFALKRVEL